MRATHEPENGEQGNRGRRMQIGKTDNEKSRKRGLK